MDDIIWFKELHDLELEEIRQLKLYIRQGVFPDSDWHKRPSDEDSEGITMEEWIETLETEFKRLGL
ncbi:hypothetical protein [Ammoniphilus sp. CFH 90114]|uniref:hypothetical protein n=1 Tax=Ammoniphilus sp. CFH 90114 TaxID=2493665 RepID=UPI00100DF936|nr:hypothetical protein [Ammoniphilus sp. CFH 90114]RXT15407.1 hypothetical protein EIZ39_04205 [Ammoniphilus sp. CFH 90114]